MDQHLRTLARQVATDPSIQARAALLRGRTRKGELPESRLRLAAWLGDPAASAALGESAAADLRSWVRGIAQSGRVALVRAYVAIARMFPPQSDTSLACVLAAVAWCLDPSTANANAAHEAAVADSLALSGARYLGGIPLPDNLHYHCPNHVALLASDRRLSEAPAETEVAASAVAAARATSEAAVRQAIAAALVPWALGEGDPLVDEPASGASE